MNHKHFPDKQGLYDPAFEHDSCGVGFVCDIAGAKSHDIVKKGIKVLEHMSHRGAVGADPDTGDGAGLLMQISHDFCKNIASELSMQLPDPGRYGTGIVFLPKNESDRKFCFDLFDAKIEELDLVLIGWRDVPTDDSMLGKVARDTAPEIKQIFIGCEKYDLSDIELERKLYVLRKQMENGLRGSSLKSKKSFYITNLSTRTISYKGLLTPHQVQSFYCDLSDERIKTALVLVHSRYSTNTFPTWDLAQPFRFLAHNGEINTLRGNINWMKARENLLESPCFGELIEKIKPITVEGLSDSATMDNVFELLALSGRSLEHAMMMLIPAAWEKDKNIDKDLLEFYKYHSCLMEPWDGPAAIAFTDGQIIGTVLDRNGLRPARYLITKDGLVVMASEVGVLDIPGEDIEHSGRIEPGKIFLIDTKNKKIIKDDEIKKRMSRMQPYGDWNRSKTIFLESMPPSNYAHKISNIKELMLSQGYTREDTKMIIAPMAEDGVEPVGSMGNDTPHAVLSQKPQLLYNYFKQLFAQVTNPAIDSIREEIVMTLESRIGGQGNILNEDPSHAEKLRVINPVITNDELCKISEIGISGFKSKTISTLFDVTLDGFRNAIDRICSEADRAIDGGYTFLILSDRGIYREKAALPALLAVGAVHHYLVEKALRTKISVLVESAEPREVHHFALLFGYGADCVNPYLAYEVAGQLSHEKEIDIDSDNAVHNYRKAVKKGLLKILSKMGISTLRSYKGAQIFEALGLGDEVVDKCFRGTPSRIGGSDLSVIAKETILHHQQAFPEKNKELFIFPSGGKYQWKSDGEFHLWNPDSIAALQDSVKKNDYSRYKEYAELINDQSKHPTTLRSLLRFKGSNPVELDEVEPVDEIVKRFCTGAMSYGSISRGAHESMAIAMNRLKGKSNTGEGGEDPARFHPLPNGDSARSSIKQVASGRFGVTTNYLANADEIQIKIAQGAKPGEGGQLPGDKVSVMIAKTRYTTAGVMLISPPPHHDIYSIEDLAQLIFDLKNANPKARISVKLVSEVGVGTVAAGVAKGHADMILIAGGDGGTGASPRTSIMYAGLPWELGLSETHQTLVLNDLRSRVRLQTDGQLKTGRDVAFAAIMGAEEFGFGTTALVSVGCVMLRHCHLDNCALGVATQDAILQRRFSGRPEYIVNYLRFVAAELREIMADLGVRKIDEMVGRTEFLEQDFEKTPWKANGLDYSKILYKPKTVKGVSVICTEKQNHGLEEVLDRKLIELSKEALDAGNKVEIDIEIKNVNRTVGTMLSHEVCSRYGESYLPEDTIKGNFKGIAGQSFGSFLAKGITFTLEGIANDYVGKGISGGKLIIFPDCKSTYKAAENTIIGNTAFYGAINGEAFINGKAGERFCIRNSGLFAVVEGVGDHGCEYMTGGRVLILGKTGINFAAGMSGGIAYVYDEDGKFSSRCNMGMVELEKPEEKDIALIKIMLHDHHKQTKSEKADKVLDDFNLEIEKFVKVMPVEFKRMLGARISDG